MNDPLVVVQLPRGNRALHKLSVARLRGLSVLDEDIDTETTDPDDEHTGDAA